MTSQSKAHISPLQTVSCQCPICDEKASYSKLRTTLYSELKRDITLRPIEIKWADKVSPRVDPKLFFFWKCPYCCFTADYQFFLAPFKDGGMGVGRFRKSFKKAREANPAITAIVELLQIDPRFDTSVTIALLKQHLLAIYSWEMVDEIVNGDSLQLASYYLRLSWVFHDLQRIKVKNPSVLEKSQELLRKIQKNWPDIVTSEGSALLLSLKYYQQALTKSPAVNTVLQELQVRLIVCRIQIKLGNLTAAKQSLSESKARVSSFSHIVKKKTAFGGSLSQDELREMEQVKVKVQNLLNEVEVVYEKAEAAAEARKFLRLEQLLKTVADKTYEEQLSFLQEHSVSEAYITKLLPVPKKKWSLANKIIANRSKKTS